MNRTNTSSTLFHQSSFYFLRSQTPTKVTKLVIKPSFTEFQRKFPTGLPYKATEINLEVPQGLTYS